MAQEVILVILSVVEHLCEAQADVIFLLVDFVAIDTFVNRVKAPQKLGL